MKKLLFPVCLVVIYLVAFTGTYYGLSYMDSTSQSQMTSPLADYQKEEAKSQILDIEPGAPKIAPCPLNGEMYTQTEKDAWTKRRPMTVMIENHLDSRPQSGLSSADIVYESIAEGGITRFMGVFYCDAVSQDLTLGPVRSARTYFLDWASEYAKNPIYVHVGGANTPNKANALGQIEQYGWGGENDLNQFALTVKECWRDYNRLGRTVATEHTMYCSSEALWKVAEKRGWPAVGQDGNPWDIKFVSWKFADPKAIATPKATNISFDFWKDYKDYAVSWSYDATLNAYLRTNGGVAHVDKNTDKQIAVRNLVVMHTKETGPIDDHMHMLYGTIGTGTATIFKNGDVVEAKWSKKDRTSRTIFTDAKGKEIEFARGKIWIENLAIGAKVNY